ncbi:hypothetical protein GCM10014715_14610 [Streptomyces spiralis]|uniref:Knr4/Smi1-like domain-containing protein n=1 Tax=Streptomyces spiralis TaxID=66376 RepID=A0A918ZNL0_9ACTN|nr:SMI1/KNR4 family protein [Streptomyces spiralis]GHE62113.1 hypothetical protein GCM10014715_14610 [Streptomyces spiralis]
MEWLDRLQEATGWQGPRYACDWAGAEAELGTALPADWKELWARFGPGSFSYYLFALRDGEGTDSLLHFWRGLREDAERDPEWMARYFSPFTLYQPADGKGLIMWGRSETGGRFYWLADSTADPATWPLVARLEYGEQWHQLAMSVPEFVYRTIADAEFQPFTVADPQFPPAFHPAEDKAPHERPE